VKELTKPGGESPETMRRAHFALLTQLSAVLEPLMMVLGIVFLFLMLTYYAELPWEPLREGYIDEALQIIWAIFVADFLLRLFVAPVRMEYLRRNWLIGLSLAIPFIRPLQVFQAMQAMHGLTVLTFLGAADRSLRAVRIITRGRVFLYMIFVTAGVVVAGGVGVHYFDAIHADSPVADLSEAIWWSATVVTTLSHEIDVISTEARLIAFGLRLYGLNVFCFFMASIASYLIGVDGSFSRLKEEAAADPLEDEIRMMRAELNELRRMLAIRSPDATAEPESVRRE
jgi:voltage-gated potassium channel